MTTHPTNDSPASVEEIKEELLKYELAVNQYTKDRFIGGGSMEDFDKATQRELAEATARINQLVTEARKDQIMQDFLSLSVNSNEDEVVLIGWRDGQLAALKYGGTR